MLFGVSGLLLLLLLLLHPPTHLLLLPCPPACPPPPSLSTEGLHATQFMGILASTWRTWDIVLANLLVSRTAGHAIGDQSSLVSGEMHSGLPA